MGLSNFRENLAGINVGAINELRLLEFRSGQYKISPTWFKRRSGWYKMLPCWFWGMAGFRENLAGIKWDWLVFEKVWLV